MRLFDIGLPKQPRQEDFSLFFSFRNSTLLLLKWVKLEALVWAELWDVFQA